MNTTPASPERVETQVDAIDKSLFAAHLSVFIPPSAKKRYDSTERFERAAFMDTLKHLNNELLKNCRERLKVNPATEKELSYLIDDVHDVIMYSSTDLDIFIDKALSGELGLIDDNELVKLNIELENFRFLWENTYRSIEVHLDSISRSFIGDLSSRLMKLARFAQDNRDEQATFRYAVDILPEWNIALKKVDAKKDRLVESVMPSVAPELYSGLRSAESPPDFVKRVYGDWLGRGLTRANIRQLDPGLYRAIDNWSRKPGNQWPEDVDLPTLKEQNTRWVDRVQAEGMAAVIPGGPADAVLREARRFAGIKHRRDKG